MKIMDKIRKIIRGYQEKDVQEELKVRYDAVKQRYIFFIIYEKKENIIDTIKELELEKIEYLSERLDKRGFSVEDIFNAISNMKKEEKNKKLST